MTRKRCTFCGTLDAHDEPLADAEQKADAERYRKLRRIFDAMKTSTTERFLDCIWAAHDQQTLYNLDAAIDAAREPR